MMFREWESLIPQEAGDSSPSHYPAGAPLSHSPSPSPGELIEFRRTVGRSAHMLNNLLTALFCQWDLCFPPGREPGPADPEVRLKTFLDQMALEVRSLSRACADVPIPEMRDGRSHGSASPEHNDQMN
jgi:hypothetical protein